MLLIGMFDSPFVRRVAVSMQLLKIPFEHADWSVGRDFERIRQYSPLGRVPALVLDDGEVLSESASIWITSTPAWDLSRHCCPPSAGRVVTH